MKVSSFKDHNGKRGRVGSKVYSWYLKIDNEDLTIPKDKILTVKAIYKQGVTCLEFEEENGVRATKECIIYDDKH